MDGAQSPQHYSGRVEVREGPGTAWGTVCDDHFGVRDATVICVMLGYRNGLARQRSFFGQGKGRIFMDDLSCSGNEENIFDCPYSGWNRHNCDHGEDAGVECSLDTGKEVYVTYYPNFLMRPRISIIDHVSRPVAQSVGWSVDHADVRFTKSGAFSSGIHYSFKNGIVHSFIRSFIHYFIDSKCQNVHSQIL